MGGKSIKAFSGFLSLLFVFSYLFSGWDQSAEAKKSEAQRFRRLHMPGVRPQRVQHRGQVGNLQAHKRNKYAGVYFLLDSVMKSCFINPTFVLPQKFHTLIFCFLTLTFMFLLWRDVFLPICVIDQFWEYGTQLAVLLALLRLPASVVPDKLAPPPLPTFYPVNYGQFCPRERI